jgi:ssDNA thymidine ADP-ribosyltransferase, DarT
MTQIYHITHVSNLERIITTKGLWCDAARVRQKFESVGIAHQTLKARRARTVVPVAAEGTLADYVPFYFANRSPMLYSIHTGHVEGYDGGQKDIVYLISSVERVAQGNRQWCFTDGHAVEAVTKFFCVEADLNEVDWEVINYWSWKNTEEDPDRKRRKQAEFLIHEAFPWKWVDGIGVINAAVEKKVAKVLAMANHQPPVTLQPKWYY